MSILSRFRSQNKKDKAPEELDAALANSEEEGLFMSTGAEQASPGEEAKPAAGTPVDKDATSQTEIDDLLEAAESGVVPPTIGDTVAENPDETAASRAEIDKLLAAKDVPAVAERVRVASAVEDAATSEAEVDDLLAAQDEPVAAEGADAAPAVDDAVASEAEVDDLLEAAQGGEAAEEQESATGASSLDAGTPADEESTETSDDPLAAFGEAVVESETADLAKELEEVSIEELVVELREIRAMLPQIEEGQEEA